MIYIKMQIPVREHLLTHEPRNRRDPLHVYRQPSAGSRVIGQRSYAVRPRGHAPPPQRGFQVLR